MLTSYGGSGGNGGLVGGRHVGMDLRVAVAPSCAYPARVDKLLSENRVLITGIIELELLGGVKTEEEFRDVRGLLDGLQRVRTRESDWASAAEMAFALRRAGYTVPFTDVLIAHQARRAGAGILHADRDFAVRCRHFRIAQEDFSSAVDAFRDGHSKD